VIQAPTTFTDRQKEEAKWEQFERDVPRGLKPGNPYTHRPYPWMLYKAAQMPNGKWAIAMERPLFFGFRDANEWQRACEMADKFTFDCQRTVQTAEEHARAREEGWRDTPGEAMEFRAALDKAIGDGAAVRNYEDRNMSEKAKAERDAAEAEHFGHLGEIPEKPIRRRGRPPKKQAAAV